MTFEVYEDKEGKWRWRLIAANHEIVADSGQSYTSRNEARLAADRVRRGAGGAPITGMGL